MFYIYYIENKDETDYNGIESYIIESLNNKDINWFPIMKAICLGKQEEN